MDEVSASAPPARTSWWFAPAPLARVGVMRLLAYGFVFVDVLVTTSWVGRDAATPGLYRPLLVARLLHLPAPTPGLVVWLRLALLVAAAVALVSSLRGGGAALRVAGTLTAGLYLWWMVVAMSYGKVDHDRFAYLVLLAALPTVGRARLGDRTASSAAGWALRLTQVAAIATYFLAAWAKIRIGGWGWVNGGTLAWAIVRRPTAIGTWLLRLPLLLQGFQWLTLIGELASPLVFAIRSERRRSFVVLGLYGFHAATFAVLGIIFLPHLVALAAFLQLERLIPDRPGVGAAITCEQEDGEVERLAEGPPARPPPSVADDRRGPGRYARADDR